MHLSTFDTLISFLLTRNYMAFALQTLLHLITAFAFLRMTVTSELKSFVSNLEMHTRFTK